MSLTRGFSFQDVILSSRPQWPCQAPDKKWASVNSLTRGGGGGRKNNKWQRQPFIQQVFLNDVLPFSRPLSRQHVLIASKMLIYSSIGRSFLLDSWLPVDRSSASGAFKAPSIYSACLESSGHAPLPTRCNCVTSSSSLSANPKKGLMGPFLPSLQVFPFCIIN